MEGIQTLWIALGIVAAIVLCGILYIGNRGIYRNNKNPAKPFKYYGNYVNMIPMERRVKSDRRSRLRDTPDRRRRK